MTKLSKLIEFYKDNHLNKIFFSRLQLSSGAPGIMYFYDKNEELAKFRDSFGHFLPLHIKNEDNIETINLDRNLGDILKLHSKRIWSESPTMPHREVKVSGIYGEVFLDIYLRLIRNINLLITYVSKRDFNSNRETTGIDSVGYIFEGTSIELVLSETKFVTDKNKAKTELLKDISGIGTSHLSKEYLNKYFTFILEKDTSCPNEDRIKIKKFFDEINMKMNDNTKQHEFVDIIIEKNIKIHFICFAIFQGSDFEPDLIENTYDELLTSIKTQFDHLKIMNFTAEIVFIPTENTSVDIKEGIRTFYV